MTGVRLPPETLWTHARVSVCWRFGLAVLAAVLASGALQSRAQDAPAVARAPGAVSEVRVLGLEDEVEASVRASMSVVRLSERQKQSLSEARLAFLLRRTPKEVIAALEPFGWYSPSVDVQREDGANGAQIIVTVSVGEPVRVTRLDATMEGEAEGDRFVMRELPKIRPRLGERFIHSEYEVGKQRVDRKLAERGYFKAQRVESRVEVRRETASAKVQLHWDSGPRHAMGEARFGDNAFREGLLAPLVDWQPGDTYHRNRLLRLQQRLSELDYFALVEVAPSEGDMDEALRVPIDVTTTPAKRTAYTAALSFGSDTGAGVRGGLNRRWVNARGHKWLVDGEWSQRQKSLTTQYRVPSLQWLPGWWKAELDHRVEDPADAIGFERLSLRSGWQGQRDPWTLSGVLVFGEERTRPRLGRVAGQSAQRLAYPEASVAYRRIDDPLWPERAHQITTTLRAGLIDGVDGRQNFAQFEIGAALIHRLDERQRVLLRADLGTTEFKGSLESFAFPTSLLFFAGGDRSIRGYGYREVGPRFEGEVLGGLHRIVASAEYQYFFRDDWGAAVFVDAGDAFNSRRGFDAKVGVGVGLRWRSPVGLVGVDVAQGLDKEAGGSTRLHIAFGVGF